MSEEKMNWFDRRMHIRHKAKQGAYIMTLPDYTTMGSIVDINKDGLTFTYKNGSNPNLTKNKHIELAIILSAYDFHLDKIQAVVISDHQITENQADSYFQTRRCGIQFRNLTYMQQDKLDYFILHHTI